MESERQKVARPALRGSWMPGLLATAVLGFTTTALIGCCCTTPIRPRQAPVQLARGSPLVSSEVPPPIPASDTVTFLRMQNVHFRMDEILTLRIRHLRGVMRPVEGWTVIDFGAPQSFLIGIQRGEVGLTPDDLLHLLNGYVFNYPGAPLTISEITFAEGQLRQRGTLHKVVNIPFEMTASISATPDGLIRLHPTAMEICNIPGEGLMRALDIELEELLDLTQARGVRAEGNDLLLDPSEFLPPPAIEGHIAAVRIEGGEMIQVFSAAGDTTRLPSELEAAVEPTEQNYMFFVGSTLRFGKLYMTDSELRIIDLDPQDPFDFFLESYQAQLVAGYSRTMPDFGLKAYMPDFDQLGDSLSRSEPIRPVRQ